MLPFLDFLLCSKEKKEDNEEECYIKRIFFYFLLLLPRLLFSDGAPETKLMISVHKFDVVKVTVLEQQGATTSFILARGREEESTQKGLIEGEKEYGTHT